MDPDEITMITGKWDKLRNLVAFWILGLTNNFAYVVMLSAAHDILKEEEGGDSANSTANTTTAPPVITTLEPNVTTAPDPNKDYLSCNTISTGAILLADILPTLVIKSTAPFFIQRLTYSFKVVLVVLFALASFIIVGLAHEVWISIIGVVCASCSGGLGEITFLSLTAFYDTKVVSTWSSGTGAAGVGGALIYAGMTSITSPRNTVLSLIVVPIMMGISYFIVLTKPESKETSIHTPKAVDDWSGDTTLLLKEEKIKTKALTLKQKLRLVPPLMKYMIPLTTVYFAEYFINQGLHELLYFNNTSIADKAGQYRWYQVCYQLANMGLLIAQVYYRFIPYFEIIVVIIIWEGLLGGSAYVNTFYKIRKEVEPEFREFSLGVATLGDTVGIAVAGAVAIPSHNHICSQRIKI